MTPLRYISCLVILFLSVTAVLAQEEKAKEDKKSFWANLDSIRAAKMKLGKGLFTPFIAPSYSPELEFLVSAGGLYTFKVDKEDPILERSSVPFSVGYSSNGSLQITAILTLYGRNDKNRSIAEFWLKNMPDNYWGVGYEKGRNIERSDSTTAYDRDWWKIYYKLVHRFGKYIFIGGILDMNKTEASNLNLIMAEDPDILEFGTEIRNSGIGVAVQYDSRDLIVNAYKGVFLDLSFVFYGKFLRGEHTYQSLQVDYRQYKNMGKERRTLAWQVKGRATFNNAPWPELSQFGNPFDLRGYRWGRFRDESMLYGMVEYRHMFNRKKPNKKGSYKSRSGFTAWVGTATLGTDIGDFANWLPNYGVGYRLETQPRMNVRIDYGFGVDSNAIYITFNEAF